MMLRRNFLEDHTKSKSSHGASYQDKTFLRSIISRRKVPTEYHTVQINSQQNCSTPARTARSLALSRHGQWWLRMLHYLRHMSSCACPPSGQGASYTAFPGACDAASRGGAVGVGALLNLVLMVPFFCVVLLVVLVGLALCSNMSGAHFARNALNVWMSALLHGFTGQSAQWPGGSLADDPACWCFSSS